LVIVNSCAKDSLKCVYNMISLDNTMQSTVTRTISRRQFLRGNFHEKKEDVRPPWALLENDFINTCSRCSECIDKCPEKIIVKGDGGFPMINFDLGECTFCEECVDACKTSAIVKTHAEASPWTLKAHIGQSCVAKKGVECRICGDSCEVEAIHFRYLRGAVAQPETDDSACTGCGACVATCPVNAVDIRN
jgi:ferredoxin-type protein NapF